MIIHTPLNRLIFLAAVLLLLSQPVLANPPTSPGQPSGEIQGSSVTLNWPASSDDNGVAGYNVYLNDQYLSTVAGTSYSGTVNADQDNVFYVVAFDESDADNKRRFSPRSPELSFTAQRPPNDDTTPTAPTSLKLVRTSGSTATLSWTASTDDVGVYGYNVYRNMRYVGTVSGIQLIDTQLIEDTTYVYFVIAFDGDGNFSKRSSTVSTDDDDDEDDTRRPDVVQGLKAIISSNGNVAVNWDLGIDNVGVDGYNLYRNGDYLTTVFTNSYTDTTATTGENTRYAVVAFDAARNYSRTSDYVNATTGEPPTDEPPTDEPPNDDKGTPPKLRDPDAPPIPSPPASDPFGSQLEIDNEAAVAGGAPTQPKNLRAELVSNDWAEINWAPSNDDGEVVEYRVYRSDGVIYTIREDQVAPNSGNQGEIDRFWRSTLFIDCNYTRFDQQIHNCRQNQPGPGDEFTYEVSAVDNDGQESARSEPLTVFYHEAQNAPIPYYNDFYKPNDDRFVQEHDLSRVRYFIDDFNPVFTDDFNGSEINSNYWNTQLVWGDSFIINGEQQYFVDTQEQPDFGYNPFNLTGDTLIIESVPTPDSLIDSLPPVCDETDLFNKERCAFLSGALSSHDKFGLTYGYVESRMKVGSAVGSLSSFYLYHRYPGTGITRHAPEIDIIEYLGENPFGDEKAFQTYHYDNVLDGSTNSAPTMSYENPDGGKYDEDFHTYGVLWEPQLVIWYIDGEEIKRMTGPQVGRQQMNLVTYLVSGSAWAPTPDVNADIFPLQFEIDYIKAYQRPPFAGNGVYPD